MSKLCPFLSPVKAPKALCLFVQTYPGHGWPIVPDRFPNVLITFARAADQIIFGTGGAGLFRISDNGRLVYAVAGSSGVERSLVWVDREGREEAVDAEPRPYVGLRVAPDGERAAVVVLDGDGNEDVLIYDLVRNIPTRFTFDPASDSYPIWSPDGERVVFASTRGGPRNLFWKAADGTGEAQRLTTSEVNQFSSSWSPDGMTLVLAESHPQTALDIAVLAMDDERASATLIETEFGDAFPEISPDGRWMAYHSNESGQYEIYVRPFPNVDTGRWQVSRGGGRKPVWAPDGRELFYRRDGDLTMMVVAIETEPTFNSGNSEVLFEATDFPIPLGPRRFDAFADSVFTAVVSGQEEFSSRDTTTGNYNQFWLVDREFDNRTSLVVDPPNGRLPALTPAARRRTEARRRISTTTRRRPGLTVACRNGASPSVCRICLPATTPTTRSSRHPTTSCSSTR